MGYLNVINNDLYRVSRFAGYITSLVLLLTCLFYLVVSIAGLIGKADPFATILFFPGLFLGVVGFVLFKLTSKLKDTHPIWVRMLLLVVSSCILITVSGWILS